MYHFTLLIVQVALNLTVVPAVSHFVRYNAVFRCVAECRSPSDQKAGQQLEKSCCGPFTVLYGWSFYHSHLQPPNNVPAEVICGSAVRRH